MFQSQSVCSRNTSIWCRRLMGMWLWTDQKFLVVFSILRQKGAGRRWWERWPSKIDFNSNIAAVAEFVKNDHRITSSMIVESLNIPKTTEATLPFTIYLPKLITFTKRKNLSSCVRSWWGLREQWYFIYG